MPSSYSASCRFELQFTGENLNTWGIHLNTVITKVDFAIAGWTTIALTGSRALTTVNGGPDEASSAALKFTGAGNFVVTIPSASKGYYIWNACLAPVTITTGSGATVILDPNDIIKVFCDGTNVTTLGFNSQSIKDYIASVAFAANAGNLPAQPGNAGKFVTTDGANATWKQIQTTDIGDWTQQHDDLVDLAAALAVAL